MNFPPDFEKRVCNDPFLGYELLDALNTSSPVSIRLNPSKLTLDKIHQALSIQENIPWCENAFYLKERPQFTLDPLFHAGCYYPQEAGSMVLDSILRKLDLDESPIILDLCAAPGGKSTLIASFLNNKGLLVSNEVIQSRAKILRENLTKWGASNVLVTNNDPKDFQKIKHFFDVAIIDAPCSGEGMFRKDPQSRTEWSQSNVDLCAARQKRIVADVWESIKPGGFIVYSTCTFNEQENEENIKFITEELGANLLEMNFHDSIQKGRNGIGYYCIPGKTVSEGLYFAILQKEDAPCAKIKFETKKDIKLNKELSKEIEPFAKIEAHDFFQWNDSVLAFPSNVSKEMQHLCSKMHIVNAGINAGSIQRKGLVPSQELAYSQHLVSNTLNVELSKEQALKFLHGDTFPINAPIGNVLFTYHSVPLAWVKNLGNRFNNNYPKEWRIRMRISE